MPGVIVAVAPALPLHEAGPYVAAAYIVFLAVVLVYVAIMARRLTRNQRELGELKRQWREREGEDGEVGSENRVEGGGSTRDGAGATPPDRQVTGRL